MLNIYTMKDDPFKMNRKIEIRFRNAVSKSDLACSQPGIDSSFVLYILCHKKVSIVLNVLLARTNIVIETIST